MIRVLEMDYAWIVCRQLLFLLVDEHPKSNVGHGMAWGNLLDCRPYQCSLNLVVRRPYFLLFNLDHQLTLTYDFGKFDSLRYNVCWIKLWHPRCGLGRQSDLFPKKLKHKSRAF
jgi:hypothetical protein